uniref:tumor necrosis factor receptor superfamily member 9 n=1 Tax=Euleptes europaea TaxID=460621 RepID=UPI0025417DE0|nr:tumor necrosis factor receptor superfamily member 9 [Euleptes europaea]
MGVHVGLPLLSLLLLLWGRRSSRASCQKDTYLGPNEKCFPCTICEGEQVYEKECTETANAVCKCIRCEECGIGKQRTKEGCRHCPQGTFNNQVNGVCIKWTQCPSDKIMTPGTEAEDVICMPEFKGPSTAPSPTAPGSDTTEGLAITASIGLTVAVVVSLLLFSIFFSLWARMKFPAIFMKFPLKSPAQEVEDCSCCYPEEEEGGGSDTSGLKGELLENIP